MILIGMAGRAGAGKDTVADRLVAAHGFIKFSFSDQVYAEVVAAYPEYPGITEHWLRDRNTKDTSSFRLAPHLCTNLEFRGVARNFLEKKYPQFSWEELNYYPMSPREVLQLWGTEYRRAQDPDYWVNRAQEWLDVRPAGVTRFVNASTRFTNECGFIRDNNAGSVWHVLRKDLPPMANEGHASEKPLPIRIGDRIIYNIASIDELNKTVDDAVDDLLRSKR